MKSRILIVFYEIDEKWRVFAAVKFSTTSSIIILSILCCLWTCTCENFSRFWSLNWSVSNYLSEIVQIFWWKHICNRHTRYLHTLYSLVYKLMCFNRVFTGLSAIELMYTEHFMPKTDATRRIEQAGGGREWEEEPQSETKNENNECRSDAPDWITCDN